MGKRELVALLGLSSWCLVMVVVALPRGVMGLSAGCVTGISICVILNFKSNNLDRIAFNLELSK